MNRLLVTLLSVVILVAGYGMGRWVKAGMGLSNSAIAWLCIILAGAFGGMLYAFRDGGLEIPAVPVIGDLQFRRPVLFT